MKTTLLTLLYMTAETGIERPWWQDVAPYSMIFWSLFAIFAVAMVIKEGTTSLRTAQKKGGG